MEIGLKTANQSVMFVNCVYTCVLLQVGISRSCDHLVYSTRIDWMVSYIAVVFHIVQGAA